MKKLDRKGFTLVELIATIVVLSLVMTLGTFAVGTVIKNSKERNYDLLIKNVKSAVEQYRIACKYSEGGTCQSQVTLGFLVTNGYLTGNEKKSSGNFTLVNPRDNVDISNCSIKYTYSNGKVVVTAVSPTGSCPTRY